MTPAPGMGASKMTRGKAAPTADTPKIDATPRDFGLVPLRDARIVPARCGKCGRLRHYALPTGLAWSEHRKEARCRDCGAVGELGLEART